MLESDVPLVAGAVVVDALEEVVVSVLEPEDVAEPDAVVEVDDDVAVAEPDDVLVVCSDVEVPDVSVEPELVVVVAAGAGSFAGATAGTARDSPAARVSAIRPSPWS